MGTTICAKIDHSSASCERIVEKLKGVGALLICVLAVLAFILYLAPRMEKPLMLEPVARFIDERDIEANMYFYTEVEAFSEAHLNMENSMDYPPLPVK